MLLPRIAEWSMAIPVITETISLKNNKYGEYLSGIIAQQNRDYDKTTHSFSTALNMDKDNNNLKKKVYLIKAVRGETTEALALAHELNTGSEPELLTDYFLIAEAFKKKNYPEAEKLLSAKPFYGPDNILKPVLSAWISAAQGDRIKAEKELAPLQKENMDSSLAYYRALLALYFKDKDTAKKEFQKKNKDTLSQNTIMKPLVQEMQELQEEISM